eukprot:CAMPEP_0194503188 /NCGR_PEP_ID=MMETSP0253-20130528/28241_1 /TAXON_ID=2966 /ORGANISM="Noctiluca scintillans" /LENGTH=393 /DNA_ID=CAMNT_0039345445 /DNA_START=63 /DNA_END=1244 /DNA_ORIENTATION=-
MAEFPISTQRRRLTVSQCDTSMIREGDVERSNEDLTQRLRKAGLDKIFTSEALGGRKAVYISSVTDVKMKKKESFAEKDHEVLVRVGSDPEAMVAWVSELGVGCVCKKGLKLESPNQDSYSLVMVEGDFGLFGVFDGHGPYGHDVSDVARQYLMKDLVVRLKLDSDRRGVDPAAAFSDSFLACQAHLTALNTLEDRAFDSNHSGTTCTMAFADYKSEKITIAHVGDSRSVLGTRQRGASAYIARELTVDHKPNLASERYRIENAHPPGRVVFDGFYNHRVFAQSGVYPGLNMSRALGDILAHRDAGLSASPDIATVDLSQYSDGENDVVLLLCTDGVWEFIDNPEALTLVADFDKPNGNAATEKLALESFDRWMQDSENEISDDITAMRIQLF